MYRFITLLAVLVCLPDLHAAPPTGYQRSVPVTAPTRLDWTFALSNRSLDPAPKDWLPDNFDSRKQKYELHVPARRNPRKPLPLILFVSPGEGAMGWKHFASVCKREGFLFAGPVGAGNRCPSKQRVRIVLDVLDDVRRQFPVDPDRTYIAGFSGGGRIACAIAFALPEYFGGVLAIGAGGGLREESWLRQRVIDRLRVALMAGEKDFNRGEVERYRGPFLKGVGVTTRVWVQPRLGHGIPPATKLAEAVQWLEEGLAQRRALARRWPASRLNGAPTRKEWSQALLAEGKQRLKKPETLYSGLMQIKGCMIRWDGLPAATEARKLLLSLDARKERPWEKEDLAEQRRFLLSRARALDAYASGPLPAPYRKMRSNMAQAALGLWQKILADRPDSAPGQEARKRIAELRKLLKED